MRHTQCVGCLFLWVAHVWSLFLWTNEMHFPLDNSVCQFKTTCPLNNLDAITCQLMRCIFSLNNSVCQVATTCPLVQVIKSIFPLASCQQYWRWLTGRLYWLLQDEISVENGLPVVLLGSRVIVPETLRGNILQQIHRGHFGKEKCKLRAKSCVYWPSIYRQIESFINSRSMCQKH